jgi:hypothetical protein
MAVSGCGACAVGLRHDDNDVARLCPGEAPVRCARRLRLLRFLRDKYRMVHIRQDMRRQRLEAGRIDDENHPLVGLVEGEQRQLQRAGRASSVAARIGAAET